MTGAVQNAECLGVAAWENDLDRDKARRVLDGAELVDVTAG